MNFVLGYELKDDRMSAKQQIPIRRTPEDDSAYSIRPSFLMPYMIVRTADVEGPLFLRRLVSRSGPWPASSAVIRCPGIAWSAGWAGSALWEPPSARRRCPSTYWPTSIIKGSTARRSTSPRPSATGAAWSGTLAEAAGSDKLKVAYQVFKDEASAASPKYAPKTVSTDGWKGTQAAWKMLFTKVVILLCFLHGWLKIRDPPNTLKRCLPASPGGFGIPICARPPEFCTTPARSASGRPDTSQGIVLEKVLDLCGKGDRWSIAYRHPGGHRTSNMLDRLMRGMNRYFYYLPNTCTARWRLADCTVVPGPCCATSRPGIRRWRGKTKAGGAPPNDLTNTDTMTVGCNPD